MNRSVMDQNLRLKGTMVACYSKCLGVEGVAIARNGLVIRGGGLG